MHDKHAVWRFVEDLFDEHPEITAARRHSMEAGVEPVSPAVGAQLAQLAAATGARQIMEIGTGFGVSALWLLIGAPEATLTSIDLEVEYQQSARESLTAAGIPASRARLIAGRATEVLPRINDGSYDLVVIDADGRGVIEYVEHALRIASAGGTVAVVHALWHDAVPDPVARDEATTAFRTLITEVVASDAVVTALSPVGDGLLLITKRGI